MAEHKHALSESMKAVAAAALCFHATAAAGAEVRSSLGVGAVVVSTRCTVSTIDEGRLSRCALPTPVRVEASASRRPRATKSKSATYLTFTF
jgi:hypothetical protein